MPHLWERAEIAALVRVACGPLTKAAERAYQLEMLDLGDQLFKTELELMRLRLELVKLPLQSAGPEEQECLPF